MARFTRGKLAVLVTQERTAYVNGPTQTEERAYLYVVTSAARDGSAPRKVHTVNIPLPAHGSPYVFQVDHNAANVRGAWYAVGPDVDPIDVANNVVRLTDGRPHTATAETMHAAIRWAMHGFYPGADVFVTGQLGTCESANPDGSYVVKLAHGETVTARASNMAHR